MSSRGRAFCLTFLRFCDNILYILFIALGGGGEARAGRFLYIEYGK